MWFKGTAAVLLYFLVGFQLAAAHRSWEAGCHLMPTHAFELSSMAAIWPFAVVVGFTEESPSCDEAREARDRYYQRREERRELAGRS